VLNFIGTTIYIVVLSSIGYSLGGQWTKLNHSLSLASYILVVVVVLAIVGFVLYRLRAFRRESAEGAVPAPATERNSPERTGRHRQG
jgi:membrane protein DedA with SNARE-associated domain